MVGAKQEASKEFALRITKEGAKWIPFVDFETKRKKERDEFETKIRDTISSYVRNSGLWPKYLYLGKKEYNLFKKIFEDKTFNLIMTNGESLEVSYYDNIRIIEVNLETFLTVGN